MFNAKNRQVGGAGDSWQSIVDGMKGYNAGLAPKQEEEKPSGITGGQWSNPATFAPHENTRQNSASPVQNSASPVQNSASPDQNSASPVQNSAGLGTANKSAYSTKPNVMLSGLGNSSSYGSYGSYGRANGLSGYSSSNGSSYSQPNGGAFNVNDSDVF